jgi:hypothetical protein
MEPRMQTPRLNSGTRALSIAATLWFIAATIGQWAFVFFILAFYGGHSLSGNFTALNSKPHITGYVPGDSIGNTQWLMHVFLAALVTFSGVLQLIPAIRQRLPRLHRWNGRVFMLTALIATLTGFYLTWIRGSQLNLPSALSTSLNGVLIIVFVVLAWRSAWQRDFTTHRRHALRAYLLVNGVWFLRIGIIIAGLVLSSFGIKMSLDSPAFLTVSYLSWILPIALLQLYFSAQSSSNTTYQYSVAGLLVFLSLLTLAGGIAAMMFMWWPYL